MGLEKIINFRDKRSDGDSGYVIDNLHGEKKACSNEFNELKELNELN